MYETGKLKRIYKTDRNYRLYRSRGRQLIIVPPSPPAGAEIPTYSIFAHVFDDTFISSKNVQLWVYLPKNEGGEGEWKPSAQGATQKINNVPYQVQWKDEKGASWVKLH